MDKKFFTVLLVVALAVSYVQAQQIFHGAFVENFNDPTAEFFNLNLKQGEKAGEANYRYFPGFNSLSENGTKVMLIRLNSEDPAGSGSGPEIATKEFTYFGTYTARVKIPNTTAQPNVGAVAGCFTYHVDNVHGVSQVGIEWHIADPRIVYLFTLTGTNDSPQRVERIFNLANGIIYGGNQPETIRAIENFNAASQFYTYGFDWYPDRIVWWINHPSTEEKTILWDHKGLTPDFTGIPVSPTRYLFNFWHTNDRPVATKRNSIEKPLLPYELEIDWMSYTPFEDLNKAYRAKINN